jgi:hypothetical protein
VDPYWGSSTGGLDNSSHVDHGEPVYWKGSLFWQRVFFAKKFSAFSSAKRLLSCIHHVSLFFLSPVDALSHECFPFFFFGSEVFCFGQEAICFIDLWIAMMYHELAIQWY